MKAIRLIISLVCGLVCAATADAQVVREMQKFAQEGYQHAQNMQARKMIRQGNRQFRSNNRREALVTYYKGLNADSTDARVNYNLATAMFPENWKTTQEAQRDSMIRHYDAAAEMEENPLRKSKAYHNKGVLYQSARDFQNAIEAYKNALRNNPNDDEARYNLVVCQHQLEKNNDGNGGGGSNQDNQDQQDQQDQQQQQQDQQQEQQNQDQQNQDQEQQEPPMSKENAEQLLKAAMQRERETQKRVNEHQQPQRRRIEKNW